MPSLERRKKIDNKKSKKLNTFPSYYSDGTPIGSNERFYRDEIRQIALDMAKLPTPPAISLFKTAPKYPPVKMDWEKFKETEKLYKDASDEYIDFIKKYSKYGILNLDIDSLKGTPEYAKVLELIKKSNSLYMRRYPEYGGFQPKWLFTFIFLSTVAYSIFSLASKLFESVDDMSLKHIKEKNPKKYVNILKKNKDLRRITSINPSTPDQVIDWGKSILDLIKKKV